MMSVTKVVILNWNGESNLSRFLPSVVKNTPPDIEIVVADNGSTDGSREFIRKDYPSLRLIALDDNYGFAEGYNRALREVEADYYILLNSDVHTPEGWCEPLVGLLERYPQVTAVAPKILSYADYSMFEYAGAAGGFIDFLGYPFCRGRILDVIESDMGQYDDAREVFWASGACFACRAGVFRELGGFDNAFFAHQEEIDLCWRMQLAGYRIAVEPRSKVYHLGAGTLPPSAKKLYYNYRNNLAMLYKNLPDGRMELTIFIRILLNGLSAAVYFIRGERDNYKAVVDANRDFWSMRRREWSEKRRQIQSARKANPTQIYHGSIVLRYIFGNRRFGKLM